MTDTAHMHSSLACTVVELMLADLDVLFMMMRSAIVVVMLMVSTVGLVMVSRLRSPAHPIIVVVMNHDISVWRVIIMMTTRS